jgi:uncharacterized LabA/DUF88 family protein
MPHLTVWLVDIGYLVKVGSHRFKLDYAKASSFLGDRYGPVETWLFNGYDRELGIPDGLQRFYDAMRQDGMHVRLHPMCGSPQSRDHRQRRVDVDIAAHLVWQAHVPGVRTLVLTTGDQDFLPAFALIREQTDKRLVLFSYDEHVSAELVEAADEYLLIDAHREALSR